MYPTLRAWRRVGIRYTLRRFKLLKGSATQRFSNYKDYIIATSVHGFEGKRFEASFVIISPKTAGCDEEIVHAERLQITFAYGVDARAAANRAGQAYVDNRTPRAP